MRDEEGRGGEGRGEEGRGGEGRGGEGRGGEGRGGEGRGEGRGGEGRGGEGRGGEGRGGEGRGGEGRGGVRRGGVRRGGEGRGGEIVRCSKEQWLLPVPSSMSSTSKFSIGIRPRNERGLLLDLCRHMPGVSERSHGTLSDYVCASLTAETSCSRLGGCQTGRTSFLECCRQRS